MGIAPIATELAMRGLPLAGRLQYFIKNWEMLTQDQEAVQGYRVPFTQTPYQPQPPRDLHHPSEEEEPMQEEIKGMLEKQAIEETTPRRHGFVSTIFLVPKKDRGQRPVINLKSLNRFVHTEHFKMGGNPCFERPAKSRRLDGKGRSKGRILYAPDPRRGQSIPQVLVQRPHIPVQVPTIRPGMHPLGKTLKPIAAQLRQLGMRLIVYIDDLLILAESRELAQDHAIGLVSMLENLSFAVSKAKCQLEPTQTVDFLGFLVNSLEQELSLPSEKVIKIRVDTRSLLEGRQVLIRKLSQLHGKLQAATRAEPLAPLFFCKVQRALRWGLEQSDQDYSMQ